ncbi:polyamine deacetylase HDAC10-like [Amphibalanus amphitrite]|uniref:polyamine deacetylase HDAC10-like n=1 Tax=Amphibalanus amphitrite TaxID=1232801 RepID=UPI001C9198C2|nr:polyamine deacetylase HDAC10-like [Amphibalanus amphitrite]
MDDLFPAVRSVATGLLYDEELMLQHRCLWDPEFEECPERLRSVLGRCRELGLMERCERLPCRPATEAELLMFHTQSHLSTAAGTSGCRDVEALQQLSSKYDTVFFHPSTYKAALLSAGSTLSLVDAVIDGTVRNGMAIIRPPGHHAGPSEFNGYCYFNNVALAALRAAQRRLKVLIVDWDVHHGQGTQRAFYDDDRVMYFSVHRYEHGEFWPGLREGEYDCVGDGPGLGLNWNVPLNGTGMEDQDYLAIWHRLLLPAAYEFAPDVVLVSAGYDAAIGCPQGEMRVSPACFAHLTHSLMSLASGRLAVVLEGGYCLSSLAESAALTLRALLGDPPPPLPALLPPCDSVEETILNVVSSQRRSWGFLTLYDTYHPAPGGGGGGGGASAAPDQHIPVVEYRGDPPPADATYPTIGACPVQSEEEKERYRRELDQLREDTDLTVAPCRLVVAKTHHHHPNPMNGVIRSESVAALMQGCLEVGGGADACQEDGITEAIDAVLEDRAVAGFCACIEPDGPAAARHALSRCQRLLVVDWRDSPLCVAPDWGLMVPCPSDAEAVVLTISGGGCEVVNLHHDQKTTAELSPTVEPLLSWAGADRIRTPLMLESPSPDVSWESGEAVALLTQLLLPLAYQLCPQLVLLLAPAVPPESAALAEHVTHHLRALAGGRLVVVGSDACLPPLLGRPPRPLPPLGAPSLAALANLRRALRRQRQHWPALAEMKRVPETALEGRKPSTYEPFH